MPRSSSTPQPPATLFWARNDLRTADNPALSAAIESGSPVVALYILDDETPGKWRLGGAARWWLEGSLRRFEESLRSLNVQLVLRRGRADAVLPGVLHEIGARRLVWNRRYAPAELEADRNLKRALKADGFDVRSFNSALLLEPQDVSTGAGGPYKTYTPFWRSIRPRIGALEPRPCPKPCRHSISSFASDRLDDWKLRPTSPNWALRFSEHWEPGEAGASAKLEAFLEDRIGDYADGRDIPGREATSRLSPHLQFGEISPRQIAWAVGVHSDSGAAEKFLSEIGWREFAYHLLFHFPEFPEANWRSDFDAFPWLEDNDGLRAWKRGMTGYPLVDAGMRELWATGYMHNRVRMIVASFLSKHLLIDWRRGAEWFWDTLVDADLANNSVSWQWVAGSGADAAPYFRIFNPSAQGERFDADGAYVRKWAPELSKLPDRYIHAPWTAPDEVLSAARIRLGSTYPKPIVDHAQARMRALDAFRSLSRANKGAHS
jgi:deoxyribodipyrimidine photo-lyase